MFYAQSTVKGLIRVKQNVFLPEAKFGFITLKHILPPLKVFKTLEKMKLYEPGKQKLGKFRSPVSRLSIQSYILTYLQA